MTHLPDRNLQITQLPNMFKKSLRTCMKYIQEYDPLQYNEVTNTELDFLGFRLCDNTKPDARINNDVTTNVNDNIMTSLDDDISEFHSPSPVDMSPPHESFCDVWFRSDSPHFLPVSRSAIDKIDEKGTSDYEQNKSQFQKTVDKWHEMIQPKLHDAEQRSTFCIRDYASQIIKTLKSSDQRKVNFDTIIQKEHPCEVARYFLASLDLVREKIIGR